MGNQNNVKGNALVLTDQDQLMLGEPVTGTCFYEAVDPQMCVYVRVCGREAFQWNNGSDTILYKRKFFENQQIIFTPNEYEKGSLQKQFSIDMSRARTNSVTMREKNAHLEIMYYIYAFVNYFPIKKSFKKEQNKKHLLRLYRPFINNPQILIKDFHIPLNQYCIKNKKNLFFYYEINRLNYRFGEIVDLALKLNNQETKVQIIDLKVILYLEIKAKISKKQLRYRLFEKQLEKVNYGAEKKFKVEIPLRNDQKYYSSTRTDDIVYQYYIMIQIDFDRYCGKSRYEERIVIDVVQQ